MPRADHAEPAAAAATPARPAFRPQAVAAAVAVQDLDEPLAVLRPRTLLAGALLFAAVAGGAAWAAALEVPVKVHGRGVLLAPAGVTDVFAEGDGVLDRVLVEPGGRVAPGQPVARIAQVDLRLQLRAAEGQRDDAQRARDELAAFHARDAAADEAWRRARDAALGASLAAAEERLRLTAEREQAVSALAGQSLVSRDRALAVRVDLHNVRDGIEQTRNERRTLELDAAIKRTQREREMLAAEQRLAEARRAADSLAERAQLLGTVLAPDAGRVLEIKAGAGQAVQRGTPLLTLARSEGAGPEVPLALVYVGLEDGKKLRPGMAAEVSPSTTRREEHGFLRGRVEWVADAAASTAGMARTLQNDQLVRGFVERLGTPLEVRIRLDESPGARQGLAWSSGAGPGFDVDSGTLAEVAVATRRLPLLSLAIPAVRRWMPEEPWPGATTPAASQRQ